MKAFFLKCIVPFCLAGLLIGCNTGTSTVSDNNIRFDTLSVEQTVHLLDDETNPNCTLQIHLIYPVEYQNRDVLLPVQQQFIAGFLGDEYTGLTPEEAVDKYVEKFIRAYREEEENFKIERENHEGEIIASWYTVEEFSSNQIVYNRNDLLSFVVSKESYAGGAHGSHHYHNRVIDLKTGQRITEDEVFTDDYRGDLAKILVDAIALSQQVETDELENIGFFDVSEIYPNRNFYADENGITYTFNEYEIAAYVVGAVTVTVPYEQIRHLLRRESPLSAIAFR